MAKKAVIVSVHGDDKAAAKKAAEKARASGKYVRVLVSAQRAGYTVYGVPK